MVSGPDLEMGRSGEMSPDHRKGTLSAVHAKKVLRRDLWGLFCAVGVAIIFVFLFDTGSLAEWVARHKHTRVDEVIVVSIVLMVGLVVLSIRRWLELSNQLIRYEELYLQMQRLNQESAVLGELGDLLQSCLSSDEAHNLITDRARLLFPNSCGAVCITASSRDLVEVVASWGEPALFERFFSPPGLLGVAPGAGAPVGKPIRRLELCPCR